MNLPVFISLLIHFSGVEGVGMPVMPIGSGYGATGRFEVTMDSLPCRGSGGRATYLFRPVIQEGKVPAVFFLHGLGTRNVSVYRHIAEHIASRGNLVIFPHFKLSSFPGQRRTYRKLNKRCEKYGPGEYSTY
jgi:predicted dienelactone hydrolase